ncbi:MAG: ABC transporter permease [Bacteroidales bacterium]|nr:ABC transporter permease [Bacteroidales bacterium]
MKIELPDYIKLFIRREGKIVLGRNFSNVWLLTAVLVATFLAIAFANGSLNYLNYKMNDPFIKWVDIKNDNNPAAFKALEKDLADSLNAAGYHYSSYSYDYEFSYNYFGVSDSLHSYLKCRFFDARNKELVKAIVAKDNKIVGITPAQIDELSGNSMGVFITEKAARKLGYADAKGNLDMPAYLDVFRKSSGADRLGFHLTDDRARVPVPVLGVVRRLPGSVDFVAFTNLYRQMRADVVFYMNNESYASSLCYFIPEDVDPAEFDGRLTELLHQYSDVPFVIDDQSYDPRELYSYKNRVMAVDSDGYTDYYLGFRRVYLTDTLTVDPLVANKVNDILLGEYAGKDVHRIYEYDYSYDQLPTGDYLSIYFDDLKEISAFAEDIVEKNELEIEMSQINAKENFQSVSVMAITLSVVMVVFAIVCILLFIVNLLQSYFQKVKRNIGTFKAFGISNRELQKVYMTIMLALVGAALVISLVAVSLVQLIMYILGIVKDDGFGYLSLWHCDVIHAFPPLITLAAAVVVVVAAAVTVRLVMSKLLSATPGDLIYDR